ncbi:uncharacterized protein LOC110091960 [Dendrobium catenatum]|uniref:uncharacterized protein LOC110091960 n=1 Tax=Dendrobium catenatum TaxID=906689 RepID=UPI0010A0A9FD|nr:uncharacterized protein LOC110091960 [Dendrobium catenatum]
MEIGDFPPLRNTSILGPILASSPASPDTSFAKNLANPSMAKEDFPVSFVRPSEKLTFKEDDLSEGVSVWSFSLVGYSLGPRPYYERLLAAMKKVWILKGSFSLLSLTDGFFLIKFTNQEDFDLVWSGGPWFLLGKPFILQKWSPKFQPKRDELSSIPIWIKIVDLPLALWTPKGISTIASYIGIPLSVDNLTAKRARLTFARVCVSVSKDSTLPDEIPINIEGVDIQLKVIYDWKPSHCEGCGSMVHTYSSCNSNPNPKPVVFPPPKPRNKGRSTSRNPRSRAPAPPEIPSSPPRVILESKNTTVETFPNLASSVEKETASLIPNNCTPNKANIPNLNIPIEEASSSSHVSPPLANPPINFRLSNKFAALHSEDSQNQESDDNGYNPIPNDIDKKPDTPSSLNSSVNKSHSSPVSVQTRAKSVRKFLKKTIKDRNWSSSCYILNSLHDFNIKQNHYLAELQYDPLNSNLNFLYK